ncbi:LCP family protein [Streptomyces kronopolitis]|uniref:LCP family protein n=1 Tax=Streptomyces kronopolitis TaxID=1612435 RepID=UPI0036C40A0E
MHEEQGNEKLDSGPGSIAACSRAAGLGNGTRRRSDRHASRLVIAGRILAGLTSAAVLAASGVSWAAYHWVSSGVHTSAALSKLKQHAPKHLDDSVNLLLIGLDSRKDMKGNDLPKEFVQDQLHAGSSQIGYYNTNTLILMHIPADGGKVTAFSIPRDDYVQTFTGDGSTHGHFKIKEAYANAYTAAHDKLYAQGVKNADLETRSRDAGREATLATVQNFLGVPIDHFAEVNLLGFYDIAQALGPIQVCLKHPVHDKYSGADFHAGLQDLNPKQALSFVRQRHGLYAGDLDRTHRQQAFLASVSHKLKTEGVFSDLGKLQALLNVVKKDLVIDDKFDVLDFAQEATNLTGGNVVFNTLPITGFAMRNSEDVNLVNPDEIKSIVQRGIGPGSSPAPVAPSPSSPAEPGSSTGSAGSSGKSGPSSPSASSDTSFAGDSVKEGGIPCVN